MKQHCTVILGSASPRRKDLLASWGLEVKTQVPAEEFLSGGHDPVALVKAIAQAKMNSIAKSPSAVHITADTLVHIGEKVFGKPKSKDEARSMLACLSGRQHTVSTAYVLSGKQEVVKVVQTDVWMKIISPAWLDQYLLHADYMDKAGAYAIQEHAGSFVEQVKGSLTNVIGLPMFELLEDLQRLQAITL